MDYEITNLTEFGWGPFYSSQLEADELTATVPVKVVETHRGKVRIIGQDVDTLVTPSIGADDDGITIGDWMLLNSETLQPARLLERKSLMRRRAPGTDRKWQLIAANIDTLFIVSSCNDEFNVARLERSLALVLDAGITPVLILTKSDLAASVETYVDTAAELLDGLVIEVLNARDGDSVNERLAPWCAKGQTVALIGSSGVGKSTLTNSLTGHEAEATQAIREDDAKGRHTTTSRNLHRLPSGGWLLDTPGMRGVEVTDARDGIEQVFANIVAFAENCRFRDCKHDSEPGCAVQAALKAGEIDAKRFKRWKKLDAEESHNSANIAERHVKDRALGKQIRNAIKHKKKQFRD